MTDTPHLSIVVPAKNEARTIGDVVARLQELYPSAEILVVDDGSSDGTAEVARAAGAEIRHHPYSIGNGGAIKTGARAARGELIVFMDGDGQHDANDVGRLLGRLGEGYDMVVGARDAQSQASVGRSLANRFYNVLASYMTGHDIPDLTSGFRAVRAKRFREFLSLLPNGFSYPTTITMAFFRAGYTVAYEPIRAGNRVGRSHIHPLKDGIRFLLIIFKVATLYSPLKLFVPIAGIHALLGVGYYAFTFMAAGRLSLATIFMLTAAVTIFLIGLVSEQITALMYAERSDDD